MTSVVARNDHGYGVDACRTLIERGVVFMYDLGGACMVMEASDPADIGITQDANDLLRAYRALLDEARNG